MTLVGVAQERSIKSAMGNEKKKLRKGIDHIGIACVFFCHDGKGNLLLQKRGKKCRDEQGRWDCGSGSMEFGETPERVARREIKEEYAVPVKDLKFCGATNVIRRIGKQKTHWVAFIFSALIDPKRVKIGEPHKVAEVEWFKPGKLPKPLHSRLKYHLATVRKAGVKI